MFKGSFVALVTPHRADGSIDEKKFRSLIEFQIANGTHGIVPCGCTGEAATLSHDEQKRMIKIAVETVNRRVPVVAGTGSKDSRSRKDQTRSHRAFQKITTIYSHLMSPFVLLEYPKTVVSG